MTATNNHKKGKKVNPTDQHTKTPHTATGLFALLGGLLHARGTGASKLARGSSASAVILATAALTAAPPVSAGAYATPEPPPQFSAAPGLPDNRIYEQVSPADKNGNEAGGSTSTFLTGAENHYGLAVAGGNSVLFEGTGPMGESPSGGNKYFVATKKPGEPGWSTRALTPALVQGTIGGGLNQLDPSSDLSHAVIEGQQVEGLSRLFLIGSDPFVAGTLLEQPEIADPVEAASATGEKALVGGSADFSTVYFTTFTTLLPEDFERAQHARGRAYRARDLEPWGFYEYREGVLREAGTLPDGKLDSFGAVPAASGHGRAIVGNQVSVDGSRAFFVSPDPASCAPNGQNDCATNPPELYVRENGERTLLVSRDTLLPPESEGLPASAPGGVLQMPNRAFQGASFAGSYVFASPDGSQAFFQSDDALTQAAEEASPGAEPKMYDFNVSTGVLTYLPDVSGQIVTTGSDGSTIAFVRPASGISPPELALWSAGAAGGTVTPVVQLPEPGASVPETRISADGSSVVFQTASRLSRSFNSGGWEQIYRYDVPANTLGCVSCAPAGVTPRGDASFSNLYTNETTLEGADGGESPVGIVDQRGISAGGERIFFDSPDPLVPQDTNTNSPAVKCGIESFCAQGQDVYEWENGVVYLISTGKSPLNSYLVDSSENGNDVFFATAEGLVPGDTDGGFDVYDARIPHAGEPYPPAAVPCEGAVCQGPPNVPAPLTPPASATFTGLGNPAPEVTPPPVKKVTTKTVKCKKNQVKKSNKCVRKAKPKKAKKSAHINRRAK